jgi:tRNA (guanine9-N1)-methyltransferase
LALQLTYCYGENSKIDRPLKLIFSSFSGPLKEKLETNSGFANWKLLECVPDSCFDLFPASQLVYLTSESDSVLETIDRSKYYIIGGLVDHNRLKAIFVLSIHLFSRELLMKRQKKKG